MNIKFDQSQLTKDTLEIIKALKEDTLGLSEQREKWASEKNKDQIWSQSEDDSLRPLTSRVVEENSRMARFSGDYELEHVDFDIRSEREDKADKVFRSTDFNWSKDGYGQISRYMKELAPLLDSEFNTVKSMTDNT